MTQTRDLIKKMADFFTGEEFYEKGEDARLELSPNDVRCMNEVIKACGNAISRQAVLEYIHRILNQGTGKKKSFEFIQKYVEKLPLVNPQEPILDKIRAEIKAKIEEEEFARSVFRHEEKDTAKAEQCTGSIMAYNNVIKLIDKYKAEREDKGK